jgi:hypothetical protein
MRSACAFRCSALWRRRFLTGGAVAAIAAFFGGRPRRVPALSLNERNVIVLADALEHEKRR